MFAAVAIGSLLPAGDVPAPRFAGMDKLEHALGYAALSGWALLLFATRRARLLALAGVMAFGIAIEFAQAMLTATRSGDALDAVADAVGAVLAQSPTWRTRRARAG